MPFPNEHSCRLRQPGEFQADSFRRITSGGVSIIIGRLKGKTETTSQAIRYPKDKWTAAEAAADCREKGGTFEAASAQGQETEIPEADFLNPADNPMILIPDIDTDGKKE